MLSLAINPANAAELLMSGRRALYSSADGGESWRPVPGEPGLVGWSDAGRLFLVTGDGAVATTDAPGGEWLTAGDVGGEPAALEAVESGPLYVALHDGSIKESTDEGMTWTLRSTP